MHSSGTNNQHPVPGARFTCCAHRSDTRARPLCHACVRGVACVRMHACMCSSHKKQTHISMCASLCVRDSRGRITSFAAIECHAHKWALKMHTKTRSNQNEIDAMHIWTLTIHTKRTPCGHRACGDDVAARSASTPMPSPNPSSGMVKLRSAGEVTPLCGLCARACQYSDVAAHVFVHTDVPPPQAAAVESKTALRDLALSCGWIPCFWCPFLRAQSDVSSVAVSCCARSPY